MFIGRQTVNKIRSTDVLEDPILFTLNGQNPDRWIPFLKFNLHNDSQIQ